MRGLIGRGEEIRQFSQVLNSPAGPRLISISGIAGVGKSTLLQECKDYAEASKCAVVLVNARRLVDINENRSYAPAIEALILMSQTLGRRRPLRKFTRRLRKYRRLHRRLTQKFDGEEESAVSTILQVGVGAVRAGSTIFPVADSLKAILTPELAGKVGGVIAGYRREADRELLEEPIRQLSEPFIDALNTLCQKQRLILMIDEYELCTPQLDYWLRQVIDGAYGRLDPKAILLVAGRQPLGQEWTARGQGGATAELLHLPLSRFSQAEAAQYITENIPEMAGALATRVADKLGDAYRLPLMLRLLASRPSFVHDIVELESAPPNLGLLQGELVKRLLNSDYLTPQQQSATLLASIPRTIDAAIYSVAARQNDAQQFEWLLSQDFINPHAPLYSYYEIIRDTLLRYLTTTQPQEAEDAHRRLAAYFESLDHAGSRNERRRVAILEKVYHQLSSTSGNLLVEGLQALFVALPSAHQDCARWSKMLQQVADEREQPDVDVRSVRRLASVLRETHRISTPGATDEVELAAADPALNILFSSSFDNELPMISESNAGIWLIYFESRLKIVAGEKADIQIARRDLQRARIDIERTPDGGPSANLLKFRIATDLADIFTREGDLAQAQEHTRVAVQIARNGNDPTRHAFAIYQLSNNYKRAGQYTLALRNLNKAIAMIRDIPSQSSRYYLGRFSLDKAITLTYMNEVLLAERAYDESREYFADSSPLSFAELSHRLGWLKRVRGDLDASLRDHEAAVKSLRRLEPRAQNSSIRVSGMAYLLAKALHSMGNVYAEMCRHHDALTSYSAAQGIFSRQGGVRHEAIVRKDKAWSLLQVGTPEAAEEELLRAITDLGLQAQSSQRPSINSNTHLAEGWLNLSVLRSCLRQLDQSSDAIERAGHLVQGDRENPPLLARIHAQAALVAGLRGDHSEMDRLCEEASSYALAHTPVLRKITAAASLARAVAAGRDRDVAVRWYESARRESARWNEYAPRALEELWRFLDPSRTDSVAPSRTVPIATDPAADDIDEIVDIYDEDGELIGCSSLRLAHTAGLWHRSFHCWILRQSVETGEWAVLLQERGPFSRSYANFLDMSSAGHYQAGEGVEGGIRECQEELGIQVGADQLKLVARRVVNERVDNGSLNREFQEIYLLERATDLASYQLGYPEVSAIYECAISDLRQLVQGEVAEISAAVLRVRERGEQYGPLRERINRDRLIPAARAYHEAVLASMVRYVSGHGETTSQGDVRELSDGSRWEELL